MRALTCCGLLALLLVAGAERAGRTEAPDTPTLHFAAQAARPSTDRTADERVQAIMGVLPLYFIENQGQLDEQVGYYLQGRDTAVYFTAGGVTFALVGPGPDSRAANLKRQGVVRPAGWDVAPAGHLVQQRWAVRLEFVGANVNVTPTGQDPTPARISYFKGVEAQWRKGLPTFESVVYRDLWPGIDLVYRGTAGRLKYTFLVKPGADPAQIRLAYRGATSVRLTDAGELEVTTPVGGFRDAKPVSYQEVEGRRMELSTTYVRDAKADSGGPVYGFRVSSYDRSQPLVLDPVVLLYAGYIGGAGLDIGFGIAVDAAGNAYVTGYTTSTDATFPATVGPDLRHQGGSDAFVAKVKADGTGLIYASYIGGAGNDGGRGIAVDAAGNAYVTGWTESDQSTFPVTVGPGLIHHGGVDAFVAKVKADGMGLVYAGYIGGSGNDGGFGIAVDAAGSAYVTGATDSDQRSFPATVGPDLTHNGGVDAFVAKVKADGTGLVYAGYIGGAGFELGYGIAVDAAGSAYITGWTDSDHSTFPVTAGPGLTYNGGLWDAFVAKVKADGTGLVYAGYIGGARADLGASVAVDAAGSAYITGWTDSDQSTFPVRVGPGLTYNGGYWDAFVAKVKPDGTDLVYAGYIGGAGLDVGFGIAVDAAGNAYVTGYTTSTEATFPVKVGPGLTHHGGPDAFVAKVKADGTDFVYAGYIGGAGGDWGRSIAVDAAGNAYVTGWTESDQSTFPVTVGPDLGHHGDADAFVAKVGG